MQMLVFAPSGLQCNVSYAITLLCIGMFFNGALSSGHFSSYVDLSPNFAGTIMGIVNTFGSKISSPFAFFFLSYLIFLSVYHSISLLFSIPPTRRFNQRVNNKYNKRTKLENNG